VQHRKATGTGPGNVDPSHWMHGPEGSAKAAESAEAGKWTLIGGMRECLADMLP
jgi:hypothetical protein